MNRRLRRRELRRLPDKRSYTRTAIGEDDEFGMRVYVAQLALHGKMPEASWRRLIKEVISAIGMTAFADPVCWTWPVTKHGPNGSIIAQPITESFLALDIWPDHDGAYLFISSCKPYSIEWAKKAIERFGIAIGETCSNSLGLTS